METDSHTLADYLIDFLSGIKRQDTGEDLQPSTLWSIFNSLKRTLKDNERALPSSEVDRIVPVLKAVSTKLKKSGLGNLPERSDELTPEELDVLFNKKVMGWHNPRALQNCIAVAAMNLGALTDISW